MASNGSFLTNGWYSDSKKDYVYLEFAWEVSSTSIAQNSTTIYWELRGKRTASGFVNAGGFKVVIDGATVYEKSTDYRIELYNGTVVASGTYTLYHDGTGKRSFGVSAQGALYYYAVNCTGSGAWELPSIPRQATLTSATDFTDEQNPTITYSNPAGSAVTALDACISLDGARDDIVYRPVPTGGGSYTFALTEAERNVLRSATASSNSRTVHFYLRTNIGGTVFHSSVAKTLSIVNASPTLPSGSVSYEDVNSSVVAITGNNQHIVQNASSLRAVFGSATGNKGAWITGYTISVNGAVVTTQGSGYVDFGAVNSSQNVTLSVTARDSRGNTTTANKTVTMLAWSLPVFTASIERLNNYEDETYLTVDASVSSVNGKNTMAISYKYKLSGGSYGSAVQINNRTRYTISCDKENAYVFSITVADRLGSTTREIHLDKGKFPLFIDTQKNAVGVNAFPESGEALRVAGGVARFEDGITGTIHGYPSQNGGDANNYKEETHLFVFNMSHLPIRNSNTVLYGFFDVWRASGTGFNPSNNRPVIKQRFIEYSSNYTAWRTSTDGGTSWSVWEFDNPPMDDYVEYRTTRRYFGKPIYTRAFSMAALPNNTSVTVGHGIPNIDKPLSIRGYMNVTGSGNMVSVPYHDSTTNWVGMTLQRVNCTFATGASVGGFPVHVIVEYTKSTD